MIDKHYNPVIAARLRTLVEGQRWPDVLVYLDTLSHSQFRTAGYMLGEQLMPRLAEQDFWMLARLLVEWNSKAFLVTILKSRMAVAPSFSLSSWGDGAAAFFMSLRGNDEDVRKSLLNVLPSLQQPEEVRLLLSWLSVTDPCQRINAFLQSTTLPTAYLLLQALLEVEDDHALLVRTAYFLMRRGDAVSFNLASLIKSLFSLQEVKGTFSLHIQPYALSRIMGSYPAFVKAMGNEQ